MPGQPSQHLACMAVPRGILESFLDDSEEAQRQIVRNAWRKSGVRKDDLQVRAGKITLKPVERVNEADQLRLGRMQPMRKIVKASGDPLHAIECGARKRAGFRTMLAALIIEKLEVHCQ